MSLNKDIEKQLKSIFSFESEEEKLQFEAEKLHLDIMHIIQKLMNEKQINKTELAKELKTTKGYITQLFTADRLLNLKTLAKLQKIFNVKFTLSYRYTTQRNIIQYNFKGPQYSPKTIKDIEIPDAKSLKLKFSKNTKKITNRAA